MGLEGLVSKHRESSYRADRFDRWINVKNRQHAAFSRVLMQAAWDFGAARSDGQPLRHTLGGGNFCVAVNDWEANLRSKGSCLLRL